MKRLLVIASLASAVLAQQATDHPTGPRITPPTIMSVSPLGVSRGATVEMTVEGFNLAQSSAIHFSEPGIKARIVRIKELPDLPDIRLGSNGTPSTIDLGPLPPRNQVTLELDISPDAEVGAVGFRLQTPLGASPEGRFLVEPYYGESPDREPNDTPETAFETYLPTILVGTISRPGDVDYFKIEVKAGDELVFENAATLLGSALQPVVTILDGNQAVVREIAERDVAAVSHKFAAAGVYYLRVGDYQQSGSGNHFYRIKVGKLPVAVAAYPLGVQKGAHAQVALQGYNLPAKLDVKGEPSSEDERAVILRPAGPSGHSFNRVKLALGDHPEIESSGKNTAIASAQGVNWPATVNGRLQSPDHYYRIKARKGDKVVLEVQAGRLGSPLDSLVEVLDAKGNPIERAAVRCLWQTNTVLRDHDSAGAGIRIQAWNAIAVGDWVMIGSEILRVEALPRTPDDDMRFESFGGQRIAFFDTTAEARALDSPVYKVQVHPPGTKFASNGLPVMRVVYRNDDGGPGYGKDSLLRFTAPAEGEYLVHLRDVRGLAGPEYAYRLAIRPPAPDFRLSVTPKNPNVPAGGRIPVTVTAFRMDEFDGPIEVSVGNLPAGMHASPNVIAPGQVSTTLLLSAGENAKLDRSVAFEVVGKGAGMIRRANPDDRLKLLTLMPASDIRMTAETREVTLTPGGTGEIMVSIKRNNQYGGRVPVEVRNLPPGVRVLDVGLNGVLINEDENRRGFTLEALTSAEPIEQTIYVAGSIETRAGGQQSSYAGEPIKLKVRRP
ncbi:MAG: hypothetical protein HYR60_01445 [Acidobacteria bacterium]|nr:hypothetical protein [Acidobacteriota bacterium]